MAAGIYAVRNKVTGDEYIGSTEYLDRRWQQHKYLLRKGAHHCIPLQHAWGEFGESVFEYVVLETVSDADSWIWLKRIEQIHINKRRPAYNVVRIASANAFRKPRRSVKSETAE